MKDVKPFDGAVDPQLFFDQLTGKVPMVKLETTQKSALEPHRKSIFASNPRGQFMKMALETLGATVTAIGIGIVFYELNDQGIPVAGMPDNAGGMSTVVPDITTATAATTATTTAIDRSTATATAPSKIKEYPITENAKDFRSSFIPVEALFDGKDGEVSSVVRYLKSISTVSPYDVNSLKFVPLERINIHGGTIFYTNDKNPDYVDPKTRPYNREYFGYTTDSTGMDHFLSFVQYYVEGEKPENYPWVVITSPIPKPVYEQNMVHLYMDEMSFPVILTTKVSSYPQNIVGNNPLTSITFEKYPDIEERFNRFAGGDPTALDGLVLETVIASDSAQWYK